MRIRLQQNLGYGLVVSATIGGGEEARDSSPGAAGCVALIACVVLGGPGFALTQNFLVALLLGVTGGILGAVHGIKAEEERKRKLDQAEKLDQFERYVKLVAKGGTLSKRQNNCAKAIEVLKELESSKLDDHQATAVAETIESLSSVHKVLPILDSLDKAERAEFKGEKKEALSHYLDALFTCRKEGAADSDFVAAQVSDESSGEIITLEFVRHKAKTLGWTGCES